MPKRVYVTAKDLLGHSRHHTVYCGDPGSEKSDSGHPKRLIKQEFFGGIARNVDERTFKIMKDLGHASEQKPRIDDDS